VRISFFKYQGTGNDFIMIDDREKTFPADNKKIIAQLCHRRFGIGADGLILLQKDETNSFYMQYFNSDGSESTMCGNGGRCISKFAFDLGIVENEFLFTAIDGPHKAIIREHSIVSLQMKNVDDVSVEANSTYVLNTGSPHYVKFINESITAIEVLEEARKIRYSERFAKEGINVNFVQIMDDGSLAVRTYERGVEDETYSCGTGVTASAIAHGFLHPREFAPHVVRLGTPGGALRVAYEKHENEITDVWLEGPASFVFHGMVDVALD
jgi:diaminopimelate epimerase